MMSIEFWMLARQAVLMFVDALERELIKNGVKLEPRTSELRKWWKELNQSERDMFKQPGRS